MRELLIKECNQYGQYYNSQNFKVFEKKKDAISEIKKSWKVILILASCYSGMDEDDNDIDF